VICHSQQEVAIGRGTPFGPKLDHVERKVRNLILAGRFFLTILKIFGFMAATQPQL